MSKGKGAVKSELSDEELHMQKWRMKRLLDSLEAARGNGTSMISLIIPPKDQISRVNKMLGDEYGTASNIKSRVNRLSVLSAITSAQQRLKLYSNVPPNGLVVYVGTVVTEEGKEKKISRDFEPFREVNTSLYLCDNRFHTEPIRDLLSDDDTFGYVVMDGNGTLFGTLCGSKRTVIHKITVDLPKKHGRGGQSALRFARLRLEKRHNYVRKVAELAKNFFIEGGERCSVTGIVLAGLADFKNELNGSDMFDPRLKEKVVAVVDVSYGGENGFNQAIELSAAALGEVKYLRETKIISELMTHMAKDTNKYAVGLKESLQALEMGAAETLIVYEDLDTIRLELRNNKTETTSVKLLSPAKAKADKAFLDSDGEELDVVDRSTFIDWIAEHFGDFGVKLEFVSDKSQEGAQFVRGFGGIGCILRYAVDMVEMREYAAADEDWESSSDDDGDDWEL